MQGMCYHNYLDDLVEFGFCISINYETGLLLDFLGLI